MEIKSGATVGADFFAQLRRFKTLLEPGQPVESFLVYGGDTAQKRSAGEVVPWHEVIRLVEIPGARR